MSTTNPRIQSCFQQSSSPNNERIHHHHQHHHTPRHATANTIKQLATPMKKSQCQLKKTNLWNTASFFALSLALFSPFKAMCAWPFNRLSLHHSSFVYWKRGKTIQSEETSHHRFWFFFVQFNNINNWNNQIWIYSFVYHPTPPPPPKQQQQL